MADLSGATVSDFKEDAAGQFVPAGDVQPDITKHDPNTFAGLTAQAALKTLYAQGLNPTGDKITDIFDKALQDANNYHAKIAQDQETANLELQKRAAAIKSGILGAEKATEAQADLAKQEQLEQWKQTGEIKAPEQTDIDKVNGYEESYQTADKLQQYHADMVKNSWWNTGGWIQEHIGGFTFPDQTSREAALFKAYKESAITPIGRGVFGDVGATATKTNIQENIAEMLPTKENDIPTAGGKIFAIKDRIMQNLVTDRNNAIAAHKDPSVWDGAIGRLSKDYFSSNTQQFGPGWARTGGGVPVVQNGVSSPGTDQMNAHLIASATQNQRNQQVQTQLGNPFPGQNQQNQQAQTQLGNPFPASPLLANQ